jgi:predicted O-methyltransferase YrrM
MERRYNYGEVKKMVETIPGFLMVGQESWLFYKVQSLPLDATIIEIGSYMGRSTIAMGFACAGTDRKIYCIDKWEPNPEYPDISVDTWTSNITKFGLLSVVHPMRGDSKEMLSTWVDNKNLPRPRFIFIDGSHRYADVLSDFNLSYDIILNGGWIALHDVTPEWSGPYNVWNDVSKHKLSSHQFNHSIACGKKL